MLTVDEAHYAKNPDAQRTKAGQAWAAATRRVLFLTGTPDESAKLRRLLDIAGEAAEDGRKVVVFSFFRDVLSSVTAALGPAALGPITGSVRRRSARP